MGKLIHSRVIKEGEYYLITIYIVGDKEDGWDIKASAWDADDVGFRLEEIIVEVDNHVRGKK
ncbi:MAG: hypothetical protein MUP17_04915 [candidate division Zixibacteria bacterium]|nr:hypothetical protein [candidate division Zixibacteria bacterium]